MNSYLLASISILYLVFMFILAYWAEARTKNYGKSLVNNPYIYSLSLAIYCTAWTYYGSVGRASMVGIEFLTVYIGPTLFVFLWWTVLRKIIRICKIQRITSIADFISSRYGKNRSLGVLVTVISLLAGVPYIALQLKAISSSFNILTGFEHSSNMLNDTTFFVVIILSIFTILFGTRNISASERHEGMVFAIAIESLVKIVAFIAVGFYISYIIFDGIGDIFFQASTKLDLNQLVSVEPNNGYLNWFWHSALSMLAFLFLPRQFQVAVIENIDEKHLNKAMWLFPLYLLLINIFVFPIALGGKLIFSGQPISADFFVLAIPLQFSSYKLALFTYIGGFSAATGMIVVETIAISIMVSNNLLMPLILTNKSFSERIKGNPSGFLQNIRRVSIFLIIFFGYEYNKLVAEKYSLVSIGMIAFVAISQFAPSVLGGLFWKRGNKQGAITGLLAGIFIWFYTLILPSIAGAGIIETNFVEKGLFGIEALKPYQLFGLEGFDLISNGVFWSLLINSVLYFAVSLNSKQTSIEHNQAILFVDVFKYSTTYESSVIWKGTALITDIKSLLGSFIGTSRADRVLRLFAARNGINIKNQFADAKMVNYAEKILAGIVGTASARMMVSSVAKEEKITVEEVVNILKKSQELIEVNKELSKKSNELRALTEQLQLTDKLKNDFLSTITHEIRTPLTAIKALSEILVDNEDLEEEERTHFLNTIIKECDRMGRLINQVLDLERYESGRFRINAEDLDIYEIINDSANSLNQLAKEKSIAIIKNLESNIPVFRGDSDKLIQVFINLISNAIKFVEPFKGIIIINASLNNSKLLIEVIDNGSGIQKEYQELIFDKFYQAHDQSIRKPKGTGLGLAITKKIIQLHRGEIWVESETNKGSKFSFYLPLNYEEKI